MSQDTIMETNGSGGGGGESSLGLSAAGLRPYLINSSLSINNTLEQMAYELENARGRITSLNNQLNSNVLKRVFSHPIIIKTLV